MFIEDFKKLDLFSEVAPDKLQYIANFSSIKKLLKGNILFYQDEKPKFASKIGSQNAVLLPYTILIENNKAYILRPKYYIALMYPLLDMGTFMTIATAPGAIENEIKGMF